MSTEPALLPLRKIATYDALLNHHAVANRDRIGLRYGDELYTFGEMNLRANRVANGLMAAGLTKGARVTHIGKNDSRFFDILGGCAKSGVVFSPISWRLAPPEMVDLLNDFDVKIVFLDAEMDHVAEAIAVDCPQVQQIIGIGRAFGQAPEFDVWIDAQEDADPGLDVDPEDIVLQIHTSGTTGRPKGAMLSHSNILGLAKHALTGDVGTWAPEDINLVPLPLFHSGGTCYALYGLLVGATTYLVREPRPDLMFDAFGKEKITKAGFVPAVIQMVVNHPDFDRSKVATLQCVYYGGAPITAALLEQAMTLLGCGFHQMFGMTESSTAGTSLFPDEHDVTRPELLKSCGRANSDTQIRIVDAGRQDVPAGESGEIVLKSPGIMKGYYKRPEASADVLQDGWYYTGDVGYLTPEGYLYIRDRLKDMIISGGENIYPAEVEQGLARHPAILECGVIGVPSAKWGEEVKACVVLRPGQSATEAEIIAHCRSLLAGYKCPKSVDFIDALPRNANGKILKRVLREPYWSATDRQVS